MRAIGVVKEAVHVAGSFRRGKFLHRFQLPIFGIVALGLQEGAKNRLKEGLVIRGKPAAPVAVAVRSAHVLETGTNAVVRRQLKAQIGL